DAIVAGALLGHLGAHHLDGRERAEAVLRLEIAVDLGDAVRECAEQSRAMRDRLVAGYLHGAAQPSHRPDAELHATASRCAFRRASAAAIVDASPPATRRSKSSTAVRSVRTLASTASRLSSRMSVHMAGSEAAMRVVSLNPRAANASAPGSKRATASMSAHAATCGRWLIAATTRSCAAGSSTLTRAPSASHSAVTLFTAWGAQASVGVTMTVAPSNRSARATS